MEITLTVNGREHTLEIDGRATLLDVLREQLGLTGSKKGCDHGQCGACTILLDGMRANSCLTLAVAHQGADIVTVEGRAEDGGVHPLQAGFIEHDAFQGGYCTPGQIFAAPRRVAEREDGELHPLQAAFIEHDAFQCGYCTPGQICSAAGMLSELEAGWPSAVSPDLAAERSELTDEEIRERMSGNICRCGAYMNIVPAIADSAR